jgi:hypothetical protein
MLLRRSGGRCGYCRRPITWEKFHADHRVPFADGGSTTMYNLVAACETCNLAKGVMAEQDFRRLLRDYGMSWVYEMAHQARLRRAERAASPHWMVPAPPVEHVRIPVARDAGPPCVHGISEDWCADCRRHPYRASVSSPVSGNVAVETSRSCHWCGASVSSAYCYGCGRDGSGRISRPESGVEQMRRRW